MSTQDYVSDEGTTAPRRRAPVFGDTLAVPVAEEEKTESRGPLDPRTEAALGLAIVVPTVAAYAALAYGSYLVVTGLF